MTSERTLQIDSSYESHASGWLADYWALTKPDINFLIAIATSAGFYLGFVGRLEDFPVLLLIHTLLGTVLVAAGAGTLNQYTERQFDSEMRRTARRPVASGRVKPSAAFWFGISLSVAGSVDLALEVNALASALAIVTLLSYLFLYTPMKRVSPLCTFIGAFPGAMPPLIGWAASHGSLNQEAWVLYSVLFLWQFPHFMAIAWMYRDDYQRAGYQILPQGATRGRVVVLQALLPLAVLMVLSVRVMPPAAWLLGLGFFYYAAKFTLRRTNPNARRLLFASIVYLPAVLLAIILVKA